MPSTPSTVSAKLRGAVVGVGHMGAHHLRRLGERPDVAVVGIDPAKGLAGDGPFDFAVIATPTSTHRVVAQPFLDRGVPCLIEKPLAHSLEDARVLAAYPRGMVGFIERFNPVLDVVASIAPRFVQAERLAPFGGRSLDVSVVHDVMVHDLDLVARFMPGRITDLRAIGLGVVTGSPDIANVRLEKGGRVAMITASRVSRSAARTLRLVDDGVYWSLDLLARTALRVKWGAQELDGVPVEVPGGDAMLREHEAFLNAVRTGGPMPVPGAIGLEALETAEAVVRALGAAERGPEVTSR